MLTVHMWQTRNFKSNAYTPPKALSIAFILKSRERLVIYLYTQTPHVMMEMIVPATSVDPTKMAVQFELEQNPVCTSSPCSNHCSALEKGPFLHCRGGCALIVSETAAERPCCMLPFHAGDQASPRLSIWQKLYKKLSCPLINETLSSANQTGWG